MNSQNTLQNIMSFLRFHTKHKNARSVDLHAHQRVMLSSFFIFAILLSMYIIMVLICIYLMTNRVEHFFYVLVHLVYIFLSEMSVQISCQLFIELFAFLIVSRKNSLYILDSSILSERCFANASLTCLIHSFIYSSLW